MRYVVADEELDIYIGVIALIFTGLGIWLAYKLRKPALQTVVVEKEVASTIYVIGWMIEYYVFFPDFYDKCEIHQVAKLKAAGASLNQIQAKAQSHEQIKQMTKNPVAHALMTYIEILPVGLLVSLIAALILRRKSGGEKVGVASQGI